MALGQSSFAKSGQVWTDVEAPDLLQHPILNSLAQKVPPAWISDCRERDQLPKFEISGSHLIFISRYYEDSSAPEADTIKELTRKLALIWINAVHESEILVQGFPVSDVTSSSSVSGNALSAHGIHLEEVYTLHSKAFVGIDVIRAKISLEEEDLSFQQRSVICRQVFVESWRLCYESYERAIKTEFDALEQLEENLLDSETSQVKRTSSAKFLEIVYHLKKRASVKKRMLRLHMELLNGASFKEFFKNEKRFLSEQRERFSKVLFQAEELETATQELLTLHISLVSHQANEVMRVLTMVSVFFLPLSFIAGVYGMNFEHMPEIKWPLGYAFSIFLMLLVSCVIGLWFRAKGLLK